MDSADRLTPRLRISEERLRAQLERAEEIARARADHAVLRMQRTQDRMDRGS